MPTQIERVARAMCFGDPDQRIPSVRYVAGEGVKLEMFFDGPLVPAWTMIVPQARAAIEAMRDCNLAKRALAIALMDGEGSDAAWQAAIDAALKEG